MVGEVGEDEKINRYPKSRLHNLCKQCRNQSLILGEGDKRANKAGDEMDPVG